MESQVLLPILLVLAVNLAAVCLLFRLVSFVFQRLSGWPDLVRRYRCSSPPAEWTLRGQTLRIGKARYRRCVNVGIRPEGLYLAVKGILVGFAPLCIGWSELRAGGGVKVYGRPHIEMLVGEPLVGRLAVPSQLFGMIRQHLPGRD